VNPAWKSIPYGRPMDNQRFYVLNDALNPCPIGVTGQLYIGGIGVAKGYWRDPERTASSFLVHPQSGERLYRTGDMGRYLPDGAIEFLGRLDHQVKIRGFRVETGEVEVTLGGHPAVREAVVITREDEPGVKQLVAYVVLQQLQPANARHGSHEHPSCKPDQAPTPADLRGFLEQKLPAYMVPTAFVVLPALPLTPNGKLDRRALPAPARPRPDLAAFAAARNPVEATLAQIWARQMGYEQVSIHDHFFELGGDSIHSIQICSEAQRAGLQINPRQIFEHPTVAALAQVARQVTAPATQSAVSSKQERAITAANDDGGYAPEDFPMAQLSQQKLDQILAKFSSRSSA
jgi:non-ribosomal peptide synthetase component F